jgi:hypothetical protein
MVDRPRITYRQSNVARIESSFETAGPMSVTASVVSNDVEMAPGDNTVSDSWNYNEQLFRQGRRRRHAVVDARRACRHRH